MKKLLIPFFLLSSISTIQAADVNKTAAMDMLSSEAIEKIQSNDLHSLLDKSVQEFIVVFRKSDSSQSTLAGLSQKEQMIQSSMSAKDEMMDDASNMDITIINNYSMLPMMAIKSNNRQAFVDIINRQDVEAVYENKRSTADLQQSLPLINQPPVEIQGHIGANTSIAILDTGVNYKHPDFGGCTAPNTPEGCRVSVALELAPDDGALDEDGHGSNVAAIAASVAPGADILALDIFDGEFVYDNAGVQGINWAMENQSKYNIVSINLSIGEANTSHNSECQNSYTEAVEMARQMGIITVFSAGNSALKNGVGSPGCTVGAVRVGAVYDSDVGSWTFRSCEDPTTEADQVTCFSNSGEPLTLLAPGAFINAGGSNLPGTSQAAPHVAGAIAVLRGEDVAPNDSLNETINHMTETGVLITDSGNGLVRPRLDLLAAVNDALSTTPTPDPDPNPSIVDACEQGHFVEDSLIAGEAVCIPDFSNGGQFQSEIYVPNDKVGSTMEIILSHGAGNGNLLHRHDNRPTRTVFDHISDNPGNEERILVENVQERWNYIHVRADTEFSDVTILVRYVEGTTPGLEPSPTTPDIQIVDACGEGQAPVEEFSELFAGNAVCLPDMANRRQTEMHLYVSEENVGSTLEILLSHGYGNSELLHRHDRRPSRTVFDHKSNNAGNEERILVENVKLGWNYIHVQADTAFAGVTLLPRFIQ